jgi:DnaJ-class molecular chaperone
MIPADCFHDNGGGGAWLVVHECDGNHPEGENRFCDLACKSLDGPCGTCNGHGRIIHSSGVAPFCSDCDGTGRHTFTVEVACEASGDRHDIPIVN